MKDIENEIFRLTKKHIKPAGEVLGRALCNDPISVYTLPNDEVRQLMIKYVFQMMTCLGVRYGEVYAISPNFEGVAIWIPFKTYKEKLVRILRCAIKAKIYKLGKEAAKLIKPIQNCNKKIHKSIIPNEHWYLQTLGVDPHHQGKGYGTFLIKHMFEKIDAQGLPVYLETSLEKNVKFYEKFGFNIKREMIIPETTVKEWFMLRES